MDSRSSSGSSVPSRRLPEFHALFCDLNTLLLSNPISSSSSSSLRLLTEQPDNRNLLFSSTALSLSAQTPPKWSNPNPNPNSKPPAGDAEMRSVMKSMPVLDRAAIGGAAGGIAGALTYFCLLPIDAVKTKLQTRGAAQIYTNSIDAAVQIFRTSGVFGFYRGVSAVIIGSAFSSAVYFGTCELGKSFLGKCLWFPAVLVPPAAGAMGNVVSSAIMVPKELITQRMQVAAAGRSWEVLLSILQKDGILGLYAGYSATLLRNLPAGILSYSSFEYLKKFVLSETGQGFLGPAQSVLCGALAGVISASLTTPLDVVKTRLMTTTTTTTQTVANANISSTVRQILAEEGWLGLTRGIGPRVLHSACFAALGYCAFETARLALLQRCVQKREETGGGDRRSSS